LHIASSSVRMVKAGSGHFYAVRPINLNVVSKKTGVVDDENSYTLLDLPVFVVLQCALLLMFIVSVVCTFINSVNYCT